MEQQELLLAKCLFPKSSHWPQRRKGQLCPLCRRSLPASTLILCANAANGKFEPLVRVFIRSSEQQPYKFPLLPLIVLIWPVQSTMASK